MILLEKTRDSLAAVLSHPATRWLGLVALIALIVSTAIRNYRAIDQELTTLMLQRRETVARLAALTLAEKFEREVDIAVSLATRVQFGKLVAQNKWDAAIRIMQGVPHDFPQIERVFLTDPQGRVMADTPALPQGRGLDLSHEDWYRGVSQTWKPYVSPVYVRTVEPRMKVIAIAAPARSPGGAEITGIVVLQIRLANLLQWIGAIDMGRDGFIYLLDSQGRLAFDSRQPDRQKIVDLSDTAIARNIRQGKSGVEIGLEPVKNEDSIVAYASVPGFHWGLVTQQPVHSSMAIAAKQQQLRRMLIEYGITLVLIVAAVILAARIVAERRSGELRFRAVAESANDAMVSADQHGRIVYFNPAAERIFGYGTEEIDQQPLTRLMPNRFHADHARGFKHFLETGEKRVLGRTVELVGKRKSGEEFPLELSLSTWRTGAKTYFTALIRDITQRRKAEERIQHLNRDLRLRAVELESTNRELESFSYSVSHDLRAPLRAIDGFSQILMEEHSAELNSEGQNHLQRVRAATHRMGDLIDDLLKLSRVTRSELRPETVDLSALGREIGRELQKQNPERKVVFTVAPDLTASCDPRLMRVALQNLLDNAWKFTRQRPEAHISFEAAPRDGVLVYAVRDDGVGFDMAYADKLFGAFQRLHDAREFPGTGIGLATVQRVLRRHGGRIWAESQPGQGTSFYFTFS